MTARKLAALASLAAGALVVVRGLAQAWVPDYVEFGRRHSESWYATLLREHLRIADHYFEPDFFDPWYVIAGVIAAVVVFLALAALRWAWRSFG